MATFLQFFSRHPEKHKRFYYISGDVLPLKIEAVKMIRDMVQPRITDRVRLDAKTDSYADIMSALHLQPISGHNRLVVIWNAEKIKDWSRITPLLYERREWNLYAVFVTNESNPRKEGGPNVYKEFADSGRLIECRSFTDKSLSEYIRLQLSVDEDTAYELMTRCAFDTTRIINAINILNLYDEVDLALVAELIQPQGEFELAEAIWDDLSWTLRCDIPSRDWPKMLGLLTLVITRLALAFEVGEHASARELAEATRMQPFIAVQVMKLRDKVKRRQLPLYADIVAQADFMRRGGAARGLLEWLACSWDMTSAA